ncbi:endo-beta-N-acetylglucosaminidase [Streptomyces sp. NA04227]|uniref:EndoS/ChiA family endoglycosidase n=1 Tax=Streptomyces sp. NA04227 TaxID=2742136 RepID=UPI00159291A9|nr:endo-beta-N-acetylglucosaminidase [Streptomyces sp. NA04227]QKW07309.1 endo-beta-N-acetylglucosaminidase [Streptomyces sp. NA04227]
MKLTPLRLLAAASVTLGSLLLSPAHARADETGGDRSAPVADRTENTAEGKADAEPETVSYFRVWRDKAYNASNTTSMAELPKDVDVAIAFGAFDSEGFKSALGKTYVPKLHEQGTKVISSVFVDELLNDDFANDDAGHKALADKILEEKVTPFGLDGIDIDVERNLDADQLKQATGVYKALREKLGPDKILYYDTNMDGEHPLFKNVASLTDRVLLQAYGRDVSSLQGTWETFAPRIDSAKFLIGFSFYEENSDADGNRWYDTETPFEKSRAYAYAKWQPSGAQKGGLFSYAVDRDGVAEGDNDLHPTTYEWTKNLAAVMAEAK